MSRIIYTDRCSELYKRSLSFLSRFFLPYSDHSFIYIFFLHFSKDFLFFLSSLKDFQFIYPIFTIENAF